MGVFLDTGFFIGLIDPSDKHYDRSIELLAILKDGVHGEIYTSTLVMVETSTLVAVRTRNNTEAIHKARELLVGDKKIAVLLQPSEHITMKTWDLFIQINKDPKRQAVSFVDCSNIAICDYRGIEKIVSFDAHFDGWLTRIR